MPPSAPVAIVTGSNSGIGRAVAEALARDGYDIGITFHCDAAGAERTAATVRSLGRRVQVRQLDLTALPAAAEVIDELAAALGGLEVLVNNAGVIAPAPFLQLGFETWRTMLSIDLDGPFVCAQRAAARMVEQGRGGRIINITSVHQHAPRVGAAPYCAAKAGLGLLTRTMAIELAQHGITVNAVAPGAISTRMTGEEDVDPRSRPRPGVPLGRPGDAREVAAVVAFLASPAASSPGPPM